MRIVMVVGVAVLLAGCGNPQGAKTTESSGVAAVKPNLAKVSPENMPNPMIARGVDHLQKGEIREAIESFDNAIRQNPRDVQGYMILGQTYMHLGQFGRAVDTFSAAVQVDPNSGEAYYLLATNLGLSGQFDLARVNAQKSVEIFSAERDEPNFRRSLALLQGLPSSDASAGTSPQQ